MSVNLKQNILNRHLPDGSFVFNIVLIQHLTELDEYTFLLVNCIDEAHQSRLSQDLHLAGYDL